VSAHATTSRVEHGDFGTNSHVGGGEGAREGASEGERDGASEGEREGERELLAGLLEMRLELAQQRSRAWRRATERKAVRV